MLGGDLQELARDLETREVEPGWAARRGQHRQRRRGAVHQPLECLLGLTALQHVEVVDEQQPVDPGALDPLHDAFDAGVDGRAAQRRGNGRTNVVQERRGMSLRHFDPAPRDRHLGRQSELHEQRGLFDPAGATTRPSRRSFSLSRLSFRRGRISRGARGTWIFDAITGCRVPDPPEVELVGTAEAPWHQLHKCRTDRPRMDGPVRSGKLGDAHSPCDPSRERKP